MKHIFKLFIVILALIQPSICSDRPQDVEADYNRAMARAGIQKYTFLTQYVNDKEEELLERPALLTDLERAALAFESIGIPRNNIFTRESMLEANKAHHSKLLHSLNAALSLISDYICEANEDFSFAWTYKVNPLYDTKMNKVPVEGITPSVFMAPNTLVPTMCATQNSQLYEVHRQRACLDLQTLRSLIVFWKKNIFPLDHFESYNAVNAFALKSQIENVLINRSKIKHVLTLASQKENCPNYCLTVITLLENIVETLPTQHQHLVRVSSKKHKKLNQHDFRKIDRAQKERVTKQKLFDEYYFAFFDRLQRINMPLIKFGTDPFDMLLNPQKINLFKQNYKNFCRSWVFPGPYNKSIRFKVSPLDCTRLFSEVNSYSLSNPTNLPQDSLDPVKPVELKDTLPTSNVFSSPPTASIDSALVLPIENQTVAEDLAKKSPTISTTIVSEASSILDATLSEISDDIMIYDDTYWQSFHAFHQEVKNRATQLDGPTRLETLSPYESELYTYLLKNIIHANLHLKSRDLKSDLAKLKFKIEVNHSGNGSTYNVFPTEDNPLFGQNPCYAEAYFNVHLPAPKDLIPSDYFRYMRSGFSNVFGLSETFILKRLADSSK